jgi:6-phosphogluconate dehydrogenase
MGAGLAAHAAEADLSVVVHDLSPERAERLLREATNARRIVAAKDAEQFVAALARPRRVLLLVPAGEPVDASLATLLPHLSAGDVVVDGGNSHWRDTERRQADAAARDVQWSGCGISGGLAGARHGASMMFGGSEAAWQAFEPVARVLAASGPDGPAAARVGPGGAGHFAKMVHNAIEYGEMQLIAEGYGLLREGLGLGADRLAVICSSWNEGPLRGYLMALTARLFKVSDPETDRPLVDLVQDSAAQTGTGRWSVQFALESGLPAPTIAAAVDARALSAQHELRRASRESLGTPMGARLTGDEQGWIDAARDALIASRACAHAQGMALIDAGNTAHDWSIDRAELARVWSHGSILAGTWLSTVRDAYRADPAPADLLLAPPVAETLAECQPRWRAAVAAAAERGIPMPATAASLAWHDSLAAARLPQNLVAAQRDAFGAHAFLRSDHPERGPVHVDWDSPPSLS